MHALRARLSEAQFSNEGAKAAFAALVANDLVSPGAFDAGLWPGLLPWVAAAGVVLVAVKTKSMLWCCVSGVVFYVALSLL